MHRPLKVYTVFLNKLPRLQYYSIYENAHTTGYKEIIHTTLISGQKLNNFITD
jgi:hypothetical protein